MGKTSANGRTAAGTFAPGNPGGPGRPRRDTERAYLATLAEECSLEDWREVCRGAVAAAKAGDPKARAWLAAYVIGSPEGKATTLHRLAVEEEAERDPVAEDVRTARRFAALLP